MQNKKKFQFMSIKCENRMIIFIFATLSWYEPANWTFLDWGIALVRI